MVKRHQHRHVFFGATCADMNPVGLTEQHVGHVVFACYDFVADAGPTGFFARNNGHTVLFINTQNRRHDNAGAIGQRNESNLDFFFLRSV